MHKRVPQWLVANLILLEVRLRWSTFYYFYLLTPWWVVRRWDLCVYESFFVWFWLVITGFMCLGWTFRFFELFMQFLYWWFFLILYFLWWSLMGVPDWSFWILGIVYLEFWCFIYVSVYPFLNFLFLCLLPDNLSHRWLILWFTSICWFRCQ